MVLPAFDEVRANHQASTGILLDRYGQPISELNVGLRRTRRLEWTSLRTLAPPMKEMLLVAEDRRFYQHSGVDYAPLSRRCGKPLVRPQARCFHPQHAACRSARSRTASHPEEGGRRTWSRNGTRPCRPGAGGALEQGADPRGHLNLVHFRGNLQGMAAASGGSSRSCPANSSGPKPPSWQRCCAPNARPALVERRACELLQRVGAWRIERPACGWRSPTGSRHAGATLERCRAARAAAADAPRRPIAFSTSILHGRRRLAASNSAGDVDGGRRCCGIDHRGGRRCRTPAEGLRRSGRGRGPAGGTPPGQRVLACSRWPGDRASVPDRGDTDSPDFDGGDRAESGAQTG